MTCGIEIDEEDNAMFHFFRTDFYYDKTRPGILPPECSRIDLADGPLPATHDTDIYQLGGLLWLIAANSNFIPTQQTSENSSDTVPTESSTTTQPQTDPYRLLQAGQDTPKFLQEIIVACREKEPSERMPAWKILEIFSNEANAALREPSSTDGSDLPSQSQGSPSETSTADTQPKSRTAKSPMTLEKCLELSQLYIYCDTCGGSAIPNYFHCNICNGGDYDICQQCFSKGFHCADDGHFLHEVSENHTKRVYYSSEKEPGLRVEHACR